MDRRSWLWRRKSSEKSPGETESSGGSISSHSERFSDDQVYLNQICQSPEVTSKAEPAAEEVDKTLSEKLSAALVNISVKEELVKQHSKVAEEAVEGWEKAENEVLALRRQVDAVTLRNSTLEDRVSQLDGALKECLRQLRQTREEKDDQASQWKITKSQLESQLQSQISIEMVVKENSALKLQLASMAEELEIRFIERELSNQAAEQASKLHLESVKKAAKFEAECRRLNSALGKALLAYTNDDRSFTDSQCDNAFESNPTAPSMEINLMDDFLEMERLVALPESDLVQKNVINQWSHEVEEKLKKVEEERLGLENELKASRYELKEAELKLAKMETLLIAANEAREMTMKQFESSQLKVVEVQSQLDIACSQRREAESQLDATYAKKKQVESRCKELEAELELLLPKVESLETEVKMERAFSGKMEAKCRDLESEISRLPQENQYPKAELRVKQGTELALAGSKFADCQKTIASLSRQLKTLATLEDFLIDTNEFSRCT